MPPWRSFYSCKRNQNTLGALPQDPSRWLCWIRIEFRREPKFNPYCAQIRSQGSRRRICPFPPPPFPRRERGPDGLAITNRQHRSRGVRACKNRKPPTLKYLSSLPHSPPPLRGKELERRRWRMQRQFLGERHEQCKRERCNATMERPGPDRGGGSPFCAPAQRR